MLRTVRYTAPLYNSPFKNICIIIHYDFFQYDICITEVRWLLDSYTVVLYQVIQAPEQFLVYPTKVLLTSLHAFHCHASNMLWYTDSKLRIIVHGDLRVHIFQWYSEFEMMEGMAQMVVIFWKPLMKSKKKYQLKKFKYNCPTHSSMKLSTMNLKTNNDIERAIFF